MHGGSSDKIDIRAREKQGGTIIIFSDNYSYIILVILVRKSLLPWPCEKFKIDRNYGSLSFYYFYSLAFPSILVIYQCVTISILCKFYIKQVNSSFKVTGYTLSTS